MIDDVRSHKLMLATYGVNTPQQFDRVVSLDVDAVVTDWPGKMVKRLTM
jgi:glycerophosphoryl diester phosphodiesterase